MGRCRRFCHRCSHSDTVTVVAMVHFVRKGVLTQATTLVTTGMNGRCSLRAAKENFNSQLRVGLRGGGTSTPGPLPVAVNAQVAPNLTLNQPVSIWQAAALDIEEAREAHGAVSGCLTWFG